MIKVQTSLGKWFEENAHFLCFSRPQRAFFELLGRSRSSYGEIEPFLQNVPEWQPSLFAFAQQHHPEAFFGKKHPTTPEKLRFTLGILGELEFREWVVRQLIPISPQSSSSLSFAQLAESWTSHEKPSPLFQGGFLWDWILSSDRSQGVKLSKAFKKARWLGGLSHHLCSEFLSLKTPFFSPEDLFLDSLCNGLGHWLAPRYSELPVGAVGFLLGGLWKGGLESSGWCCLYQQQPLLGFRKGKGMGIRSLLLSLQEGWTSPTQEAQTRSLLVLQTLLQLTETPPPFSAVSGWWEEQRKKGRIENF